MHFLFLQELMVAWLLCCSEADKLSKVKIVRLLKPLGTHAVHSSIP